MKQTMKSLLEARFGLADAHPSAAEPSPELARVLARRTHRRYREQAVEESLLQTLLACAQCASSRGDLQLATILRVDDPERRRRISELVPSMPWIASAPVFLLFCADLYRSAEVAKLRGRRFDNDGFDGLLGATLDAGLALQTFVLAAESEGLGCCPISAVRDHLDDVIRILELPRRVVPIAGLCIGYPAREGHLSMRLPPSVVVHTNVYRVAGLRAEIEAYDQRRHARFAPSKDRQKHVDRYGYTEPYVWSEDAARAQSVSERSDLEATLLRHGFQRSTATSGPPIEVDPARRATAPVRAMQQNDAGVRFDADAGNRLERAYLTSDVVTQRRIVLEHLAPRIGERILDVGSGPGLLLRDIAERVGAEGRAVGVDLSADMLALARARCADLPWVELEQADASGLSLDATGRFDGVVSTQVYEYVRDLPEAFARLFALTLPGGRVAILDTDYDSLVLHTGDPKRQQELLEIWDDHFVHRDLPRILGPLLRGAGFRVRHTQAIPICNTRWDIDAFSYHLLPMMSHFVARRSPERAELATEWLREQEALGRDGRYFFSLNRYLVIADRPAA